MGTRILRFKGSSFFISFIKRLRLNWVISENISTLKCIFCNNIVNIEQKNFKYKNLYNPFSYSKLSNWWIKYHQRRKSVNSMQKKALRYLNFIIKKILSFDKRSKTIKENSNSNALQIKHYSKNRNKLQKSLRTSWINLVIRQINQVKKK